MFFKLSVTKFHSFSLKKKIVKFFSHSVSDVEKILLNVLTAETIKLERVLFSGHKHRRENTVWIKQFGPSWLPYFFHISLVKERNLNSDSVQLYLFCLVKTTGV